jgi:hypothetical protein
MKILRLIFRNYSATSFLTIIAVLGFILLFLFDRNEIKFTLGAISVLIAYSSFLFLVRLNEKKLFEEKIQAITLLKKQLEIIGSWTSYNKGGYHKWNQNEAQIKHSDTWGNPFHNIFNPESNALAQIIIMPGTYKLGKQIIENLVGLNQEITSFNNSLNEIRNFKYSRDPYKNIILHLKIGAKKSKIFKKLLVRSKINPEINGGEEEAFKTKLVEFYSLLHYDHIGDKFNKRLYYWHKKSYKSLLKRERWIRGEI